MKVPPDHPLRISLNDEVHARPSEPLSGHVRLSFLALFSDASQHIREWEHLCALARHFAAPLPPERATHFYSDFGPFRLRWERHSEFTRYQFIVAGRFDDPFAETALQVVPADWLVALPGQVMVASHAALVPTRLDEPPDLEAISARHFAGEVLIGAGIAGGAATALTDFRVRDGFSRLLVLDSGLTPWQAGRMVQRLFEIDTYRIMALLALPVAQEVTPWLTTSERELARTTDTLTGSDETDEPVLLDRLTRLEAQIESRQSAHHYRFAAAAAYYELVQRRIAELREVRIHGLQTFQEFTERRLAPAMNTCRSSAGRLESLSQRVTRATQLLSTRVDIARERQNQQLLESMNRRSEAQLRLQQTVEGLSVAAITYYIVGLTGYAAKGLHAAGAPVNVEMATGLSIPFVAILVALGVRKVRKVVARTDRQPPASSMVAPADESGQVLRRSRFPSRRE